MIHTQRKWPVSAVHCALATLQVSKPIPRKCLRFTGWWFVYTFLLQTASSKQHSAISLSWTVFQGYNCKRTTVWKKSCPPIQYTRSSSFAPHCTKVHSNASWRESKGFSNSHECIKSKRLSKCHPKFPYSNLCSVCSSRYRRPRCQR